MKTYLKKYKLLFITLVISGSAFMSVSFVDNYFEVSKNLDIFATMFRELNIYYVDETNPGELMKKGIDNILLSLDPYTTYIPESEIEDYKYMQTGQYGGIGALIKQDGDYVVISEPYEGYPAQLAGLRAGDKILKINDTDVKGKKTNDISKFLKGQATTEVKMLIERLGEDAPLEILLNRKDIKINSVAYKGMVSKNTGVIKLISFTETASDEVKTALLELKKNPDFKYLIFDLRSNPGGLLHEAVEIVNLFVNKGTEIVSTRGKIKDWDNIYKAVNIPVDVEIPIAVLIDHSSASASEIVSGAIQDLDRGVVIGQRSYGKGLVQQTRPLSYNAQLKVTVAKYYIPSGRCIQALDYSNHNDDGSVNKVPDSLITAFKTKNGRIVYDGGGISPDFNLTTRKYSNIIRSLVNKSWIFNYATKYRSVNDSLISATNFKISDDEYQSFVSYLEGKDYDYTTKVEKSLEDLIEEVKADTTLLTSIETEIKELKEKVMHHKNEDLINHKPEIKQFLKEEIASRYYYQVGRLEASYSDDDVLEKAIDVLNDSVQYHNILTTVVE